MDFLFTTEQVGWTTCLRNCPVLCVYPFEQAAWMCTVICYQWLSVFVCLWGREIRQSCSQICPASRCCRKGGTRSRMFSVRFKTTAKTSDLRWRPQRSTTRPSLDRRYRLCVCLSLGVKDRWEEIDGLIRVEDWVTVMIWWLCVCVCVCVCCCIGVCVCISFNQEWRILLSVCSRLIYQSLPPPLPPLPPLPSVSDWGEELAVVHCSTWLGQNQQVSSQLHCTRTVFLIFAPLC